MKKILFLLSLIFICSTMQVSAMKRAHDQLNAMTTPVWLPDDIITKIAALCDPQARENFALTDTSFNKLASFKYNPAIMDQDDFKVKENRIYYLIYGCLRDIPKLVQKILTCFDPEYKIVLHGMEEFYPNKRTLNEVKHYAEQLTDQAVTNLLPYYADIHIDSEKPLLNWAIEQEHIPLVHLILKQPVKIIDPGYCETPFQAALYDCFQNSKFTIFNMIADYPKLDINMMDPNGDGHALHYAIIQAHEYRSDKIRLSFCIKAIKLLVSCSDININIQQNTNLRLTSTPLTRAVYCNLIDVAKILLADPDADPNIQNGFGKTSLHVAVDKAFIPMAQLLIDDPRTNPNTQNQEGNTALHLAINANSAEMVECLLTNSKINLFIINKDGDTPLQLAEERRAQEQSHLALFAHDAELVQEFADTLKICALLEEYQALQILKDPLPLAIIH